MLPKMLFEMISFTRISKKITIRKGAFPKFSEVLKGVVSKSFKLPDSLILSTAVFWTVTSFSGSSGPFGALDNFEKMVQHQVLTRFCDYA